MQRRQLYTDALLAKPWGIYEGLSAALGCQAAVGEAQMANTIALPVDLSVEEVTDLLGCSDRMPPAPITLSTGTLRQDGR